MDFSREYSRLYHRRVVVDDTDPRITFNDGSWNLDESAFADYGVLGSPYKNTMKGTKSPKASFSFDFEGKQETGI